MTSYRPIPDKAYLNRAVEVSIHLGLVALLAAACFLILSPFIAVVAWGMIIAIAGHPAYVKLKNLVGRRSGLAAVLFASLLLFALIVPIVMLSQTLIEGSQFIAARLQSGTLAVPPPPANVATWPVIGKPLNDLWALASSNLSDALGRVAPQLKSAASQVLSAAATVSLGVLQFFVATVIAGFLLANSTQGARVSRKFAIHLFGNRGEEFETLAAATVRSVTTGILGVALIQALLAGLGFLVMRIPGAGLWALLFLVAAVLQVGGPVLIPFVIYVFATTATTKAVAFLIWCILVGLLDNVLKPLLLGRGLPVPIVVIFLGAMGGFLVMGIIGLFVGPVILSVGYRLLLTWLDEGTEPAQDSGEATRALITSLTS